MAQAITIRGVKIGEGKPKIIVPIVETTSENICRKAAEFSKLEIDVIEWRADFYEGISDPDKTGNLVKAVREAAGNKVLLFTCRTQKEGGKADLDLAYYTLLNKMVAETKCVDLVDIEIFSGDDIVAENMANVHSAGAYVIASSHDFEKTPPKETLIAAMQKMQNMGADILKVAVMPQNANDVLTLISATCEMSQMALRPIISMSMGGQGAVSRLVGEVFGSAATFGAIGKTSAPGQIPVEKLSKVLDIINESL